MIGGRCGVSAKAEGIRLIAAEVEPSCTNRRRSMIIFAFVLPAEGYRISEKIPAVKSAGLHIRPIVQRGRFKNSTTPLKVEAVASG